MGSHAKALLTLIENGDLYHWISVNKKRIVQKVFSLNRLNRLLCLINMLKSIAKTHVRYSIEWDLLNISTVMTISSS